MASDLIDACANLRIAQINHHRGTALSPEMNRDLVQVVAKAAQDLDEVLVRLETEPAPEQDNMSP